MDNCNEWQEIRQEIQILGGGSFYIPPFPSPSNSPDTPPAIPPFHEFHIAIVKYRQYRKSLYTCM